MSSETPKQEEGVMGSMMKKVTDTYGMAKDAVVGKPEPPKEKTVAEKATEAKDVVVEKAIEGRDFTVLKATESKDFAGQKAVEGKDFAGTKIGELSASAKNIFSGSGPGPATK